MNRTLKYKLDIPGIIALVISVIIMMISNLLLSSIWTEQIKEVYFDTGVVLDRMPEEQFLRIVRMHGADKILFATDSPWEDQADYIARITDYVEDETTREKILGKNAQELLKM